MNAILNIIRKHDLIIFFLLVFGLGWPRGIIEAGHSQGLFPHEPSSWLTILYVLGTPLISAIIVLAVARGRMGLKEWGMRLIRWRVNWRWYLLAFSSYPLIAAAAFTVSDVIAGRKWSVITLGKAGYESLRGGAADLGLNPENRLQIFGIFLLINFLASILEEGGWRAYAIPRLQEKSSSLRSGLIVGAIWSIWHLPYFFTKGAPHYGMPFLWYLLTLTSFSIVMVWFINRANQSVLMPILFHCSFNLSAQFLPPQIAWQTGDYVAFWLICVFSILGTVIVLFIEGPQLGRKGLESSRSKTPETMTIKPQGS